MPPFLLTTAQQLHERFKGRMQHLAVVFPNRRQSVFFNHYLQQVATPPCFLPTMLTIEEMVAASTTLQLADNLTQGFALYEAFVAVANESGDKDIPPFDVFFSIGETLIKDFREIDIYLVDIATVCTVLYDIESIDKAFDQLTAEQRGFLKTFWRGTIDKGRIQEKFLKLWERLPRIYQQFMERLAAKHMTTMGAAYRQLAEGKPLDETFFTRWEHIAFVGFNAFNKAEETFIGQWSDKGFASLWFDADTWYINDRQQEAGEFLRRNFNQLGLRNELPAISHIEKRTDTIQVVAAEGQLAQAKLVEQWWHETEVKEPTDAGILLADESLLLPVLQSLPDSLNRVNITMGYPLQQSPVYSMLQLFFDVQADLARHRFKTVHHQLAEKWLQHPFCNWSGDAIDKLQQRMLKENLVRVPAELLRQHTETAGLLFSRMIDDREVFQRLRHILEAALQQQVVAGDGIAQGLCAAAWKTLQQLEPLFATLKPAPDLAFTGTLLMKQLGNISVPFEGEPLQGLQLMGLLESRGLDFDHLLIVGASEGSLPRIKPPDSFIPDNVRRAFGLPVPEHQDAIFAYVFYRLLHRAKSVTLVYNALVTDSSTGEVSRFIQQLAFESAMPVAHRRATYPIQPQSIPPISIPKDEKIMRYLMSYVKPDSPQKLSPSAINNYLHCRLQFFFKYLARIAEPDELEEGVEASAVGSVVHKLMELLYEACINAHGRTITTEAVAWMQQQQEEFVEKAFRLSWRKKELAGEFRFTGELHVVRAIVLQYTDLFLKLDMAYAPFTMHQMEVQFNQPFGIQLKGEEARIILSGYIDRIDEKNGVYRMADYKTGGDNPEFRGIDALFERDGKHQNKAALQTLIYSWMFHKEFPGIAHFEPALLAARHLQTAGKAGQTQLRNKETNEFLGFENMMGTLQQLEIRLRALVEELFNESVPFDQTTNTEHCRYCDYKGICGRG